jgi:DNA repair exonuclease SbcCD ATPase subunit
VQLLNLEVKNWCQHREFNCTFGRGLIAIVGRNGSGKSNLFGAVRWLLTGENPNYGLKAENVAQLAGEGEKSYCRLELEHAGHIAAITRYILPEKEQATFLLDGEETARGDKNVTAAVEALLGLDGKFISRFLLVQQDKLFRFIDDDKSDVDKFFQRLFATDKANKCQDVIGKHANKVAVPEIPVPSAVLVTQISDIDAEIESFSGRIAKLPALPAVLAKQKSEQEIVQQWRTREKAENDLAGSDAQIKKAEDDLARVTGDCKTCEDDITALEAAAGDQEGAQAAARVALGHWASYKKIEKTKHDIQTSRERLEETRKANPAPPTVSQEIIDAARAADQAATQAVKDRRAFIKTFGSGGVANCPTCHTPTTQLTEYLAESETLLPALEKTEQETSLGLAQLLTAQEKRKQWEMRDKGWAATAKAYSEQEARLEDVTPPDATEDELSQVVADYESFQAAKKDMEPQLQKLRINKSKLEGTLSALKDNKQKLLNDISTITTTQEDADAAQARLASLSEQAAKRQSLEQEQAKLSFEKTQLENSLVEVVKKEDEAAISQEWLEIAATIRDAFKSAPRIVAQRNLQKLEAYVNDILRIFGVDFYVTTSEDDGPNFVANFIDGRKQTAQRLSFGQKTVLAVAFRVAVVSLFSSDVGFLALDEPTVYMDQTAVQSFSAVLEKLRDISTANGLQCLIITHETGLSHAFESVIEITSPVNRV